jgi:hypothetical protein
MKGKEVCPDLSVTWTHTFGRNCEWLCELGFPSMTWKQNTKVYSGKAQSFQNWKSEDFSIVILFLQKKHSTRHSTFNVWNVFSRASIEKHNTFGHTPGFQIIKMCFLHSTFVQWFFIRKQLSMLKHTVFTLLVAFYLHRTTNLERISFWTTWSYSEQCSDKIISSKVSRHGRDWLCGDLDLP